MKSNDLKGFVHHFRRAGPPALLAACLSVGPAFAQSSTTTVTTDEPSVSSETTKTKIKEHNDGTVTKKTVTKQDDGDTVVKKKTTVDDPAPSTTTTIQTR